MKTRIDFYTASPDALKAMIALETAVSKLPLEKNLIELVKLRTSQINGCAFAWTCTAPMRARVVSPSVAWRHCRPGAKRRSSPSVNAPHWPGPNPLTLISQTHAPDEDYELASAQFDAKELVDLTVAITTINAWNRLAIGFRKMPQA